MCLPDFPLDWQKEPCPVAGPCHISDHLIVSEVKSPDPQLIKNSTHSLLVSTSIFLTPEGSYTLIWNFNIPSQAYSYLPSMCCVWLYISPPPGSGQSRGHHREIWTGRDHTHRWQGKMNSGELIWVNRFAKVCKLISAAFPPPKKLRAIIFSGGMH